MNLMNLKKIVYKGNKILTIKQLADMFDVEQSIIYSRFYSNKELFAEGKNYFALTRSEIDQLGIASKNSKSVWRLNVFNENGVRTMAKLVAYNAIKIYKELKKCYFDDTEDVKANNTIDNNLMVVNTKDIYTIDSREVAQMINKNHKHLLRDIEGYIRVLEDSPNLDSLIFFRTSTYKTSQNKTQPQYLLTEKGCEIVANKLTGRKGILFTAAYVTKFHEMKKELANPSNSTNDHASLFNKQILYLTEVIKNSVVKMNVLETKMDNISKILNFPNNQNLIQCQQSIQSNDIIHKDPKGKRELNQIIDKYAKENNIPAKQVRNMGYTILKNEGYDAYKAQIELGTKTAIKAVEIKGWMTYFVNRHKEILGIK